MLQLLYASNSPNINIKQYYIESESELQEIKNAPVGSTVLILDENSGLKIKMLHSSGKWIDI